MKFISLFLLSLCLYAQSSFATVTCDYGLVLKDNFAGKESSEWFSKKLTEQDCLNTSIKKLKTYVANVKVGRGSNATYFQKKPTKVIVQIPVQDDVNIDQLNDQLQDLPKKDRCAIPTQRFTQKEVGGLFGIGTSEVYEAVIQKNKGC